MTVSQMYCVCGDYHIAVATSHIHYPQTVPQRPLTGQYFYMIALLFLLAVNGHHLLIDGVLYSYQVVPLDAFIPFYEDNIPQFVIGVFNKMFLIVFQLAIPIVGCLCLVDVALVIIARSVPQLNVFVVGLPIKIFISFVVILFFLGLYMTLVKTLFTTLFETMRSMMQLFGGG